MIYKLYTDGSARNNGYENAVGGWAWMFMNKEGYEINNCGAVKGSTNQRMELQAAIEGLTALFSNFYQPADCIEVYTDSAYLHNCVSQRWWRGWLLNNWRNAKKQPVANQDLWEQLIPYFKNENIKFIKVKGHASDINNCRVDELAQHASASLYKELYG